MSVKADFLTAVYFKPASKWNAKMLEGVAAVYPDIEKCKTMTEGRVVIRHNE